MIEFILPKKVAILQRWRPRKTTRKTILHNAIKKRRLRPLVTEIVVGQGPEPNKQLSCQAFTEKCVKELSLQIKTKKRNKDYKHKPYVLPKVYFPAYYNKTIFFHETSFLRNPGFVFQRSGRGQHLEQQIALTFGPKPIKGSQGSESECDRSLSTLPPGPGRQGIKKSGGEHHLMVA